VELRADSTVSDVLRHMGVCQEPASEFWGDLFEDVEDVKPPSRGTLQHSALQVFRKLSKFVHEESTMTKNTLLIPDEFTPRVRARTHGHTHAFHSLVRFHIERCRVLLIIAVVCGAVRRRRV
jgi:hypothetical protein